jgi:hypothetical protein
MSSLGRHGPAERCIELTISIKRLAQEITQLTKQLAPALLALRRAAGRLPPTRSAARLLASIGSVPRRLRPLQRHCTPAGLVGERCQTLS